MNATPVDLHALRRETVRLTERYVREVVVALDLCPWATPALSRGSVQISVIVDSFDTATLTTASNALAATLLVTPPEVELVLLVLPRLAVRRLEMDTLLGSLRDELTEREGVATFALAAFHPDAPADTASGERFIPFLRRSPDPLVQAVRFTSLKQADDKHVHGTTFLDPTQFDPATWSQAPVESVRARIARRNLNHVLDHGLDEVKGRLDDICEDRRRTHRALGIDV